MFRFLCYSGLQRRVVAYYLLFSLLAAVWLVAAAVFTTQHVLSLRNQGASVSRLGQAASAVEIAHVRGADPAQLTALLHRIQSDGRFEFCAVVANDGRYLAHSSDHLAGELAILPQGESIDYGAVTSIRYLDENGTNQRLFRLPLLAQGLAIGELQAGAPDATDVSFYVEAARGAPLVALLPLLLVGIGAVVIGQLTNPLTQIESQLRGVASAEEEPETMAVLPARSAVTLGWNRLANRLARCAGPTPASSTLERIQDAVHSRRQGKSDLVLQSLGDGIAVTDSTGRLTFVNRAFLAVTGLGEATSPVGKMLADVLRKSFPPDAAREELLNPASASVAGCEWTVKTEQGQSTLRLTRRVVELAQERDSFTVWMLRDISQQRMAEEMRNQFLDTATHELRTPLANIKAYSELLAEGGTLDVEHQKEFCNTINAEATRLARFVDDLLSVSSMEMGSLSIEKQNVDLRRLLEEAMAKIRPLVEQKNIELSVQIPDKLPETRLDKDKIVATLVNVLGNAAKYTPASGRIQVTVSVKNAVLEIAVSDSGVGIAENEVAKVFDKFFRSADPRVKEQTGTGLGLSLAREVVRLHGGDILVRSELNKGSEFTMVLPLGTRG